MHLTRLPHIWPGMVAIAHLAASDILTHPRKPERGCNSLIGNIRYIDTRSNSCAGTGCRLILDNKHTVDTAPAILWGRGCSDSIDNTATIDTLPQTLPAWVA